MFCRKWDRRFLDLAKFVSNWSKDPSTKVGAVIVNPKRIVVGLGYNGFPRGVEDNRERYKNREIKHMMVVHAEANAVLNANSKVEGCSIYVWPLFTCNDCAKLIIQSGIKRVVSINSDSNRWNFDLSKTMYLEAGIEFKIYDI